MIQIPHGNPLSQNYFSAGIGTYAPAMPVMGSATYAGQTAGSFVDAITGDLSDITATMNATADFAALSVTFATTGTTRLSKNAPNGTLPVADPGLDLNGVLNYVDGTNTFSGIVSSTNGMGGNASGRFYGPTMIATGGLVTSGMPPEIGGTFAVMGNGIGAMQGAFTGAATSYTSPTLITGTVTPPAPPFPNATSPSPDMLVLANSSAQWSTIVQNMNSASDPFAATTTPLIHKLASLDISPVDIQGAAMSILTGAAYPSALTLGQTTAITHISSGGGLWELSVANGASASLTTDMAGLPTVTLANAGTGEISEYVLPYSITANPSGYTYQTFGRWASPGGYSEYYFSAGAPVIGTALPVTGSATYSGQSAGTFVDAVTGDPASITANMNATADFGALSVAFATTGTTMLSKNAPAGTAPTANAGLDMSGTLNFATGGDTFTGTVTTANGMTGNATGRFYGPGIAAATATKVAGAPPEIGGTFAVMNPAAGAMQGAFGGK